MTQASVNVDDQDNVFVAYVRSTHPMMSASSIVQRRPLAHRNPDRITDSFRMVRFRRIRGQSHADGRLP